LQAANFGKHRFGDSAQRDSQFTLAGRSDGKHFRFATRPPCSRFLEKTSLHQLIDGDVEVVAASGHSARVCRAGIGYFALLDQRHRIQMHLWGQGSRMARIGAQSV